MNDTEHLQNEFVRDAGFLQILSMYNLVPDVMFWVKDTQNRFIFGNTNFLQKYGLEDVQQLLGKSDFDLEPKELALQLKQDDDRVLHGTLLVERFEVCTSLRGEVGWLLTSKKPVYDQNNQIIGSYGVTRSLAHNPQHLASANNMQVPLDYIKRHFAQSISLEQLANLVHLSVSAFQRKFKKVVKKTPCQLIFEVRMEHAKALLIETNLTIAEVGFASGFSDHSYFSKQFKAYLSMLPSQFRQKYQTILV